MAATAAAVAMLRRIQVMVMILSFFMAAGRRSG
jgi:hypothetical protein